MQLYSQRRGGGGLVVFAHEVAQDAQFAVGEFQDIIVDADVFFHHHLLKQHIRAKNMVPTASAYISTMPSDVTTHAQPFHLFQIKFQVNKSFG